MEFSHDMDRHLQVGDNYSLSRRVVRAEHQN